MPIPPSTPPNNAGSGGVKDSGKPAGVDVFAAARAEREELQRQRIEAARGHLMVSANPQGVDSLATAPAVDPRQQRPAGFGRRMAAAAEEVRARHGQRPAGEVQTRAAPPGSAAPPPRRDPPLPDDPPPPPPASPALPREVGRKVSDADLVRLQAEANANAATPQATGPTPVTAVLPWAARIASGGKVPRPLIWRADLPRWRRKQSEYSYEYREEVRKAGLAAAAARETNKDNLEVVLKGVLSTLLRLGRYTAGLVHAPYKDLAAEAGVKAISTVFEAIAFFERAGIVEVLNVRDRGRDRNGKPGVFNDANAYILKIPEGESAKPQDAAGILAVVAATAQRVAAWFGLQLRPSGYFNTTPMAARDLRAGARPSPA